jgi:hypothetical protein
MPKITFTKQHPHNGTLYAPGVTLDLSDKEARDLIKQGVAVLKKTPPKPTGKPGPAGKPTEEAGAATGAVPAGEGDSGEP